MSQPRKHHYLPQFYLRGFSANAKHVFRVEKATGRGHSCSIKDAAAIRDFHTLDYPEAEDPYAVEKDLAVRESSLATTLRSTLSEGALDDSTRAGIVELVAVMRIRVPAIKRFIEETLRQFVRTTGRLLERRGELPPPPAGLEGAFERDELTISISNWKCLEHMWAMASDEATLATLSSMSVSILHAPPGHLLITGDQPVAVFNANAEPASPYGIPPVPA